MSRMHQSWTPRKFAMPGGQEKAIDTMRWSIDEMDDDGTEFLDGTAVPRDRMDMSSDDGRAQTRVGKNGTVWMDQVTKLRKPEEAEKSEDRRQLKTCCDEIRERKKDRLHASVRDVHVGGVRVQGCSCLRDEYDNE